MPSRRVPDGVVKFYRSLSWPGVVRSVDPRSGDYTVQRGSTWWFRGFCQLVNAWWCCKRSVGTNVCLAVGNVSRTTLAHHSGLPYFFLRNNCNNKFPRIQCLQQRSLTMWKKWQHPYLTIFFKNFNELVEGMEFFYSKDCYSITTYALLVG